MNIKNVVVAGGGVLGSQIAFQAAYKGFNVKVWLRMESSIGRAKPKFERVEKIYLETLQAMKTKPQAYCRGLAAVLPTIPSLRKPRLMISLKTQRMLWIKSNLP